MQRTRRACHTHDGPSPDKLPDAASPTVGSGSRELRHTACQRPPAYAYHPQPPDRTSAHHRSAGWSSRRRAGEKRRLAVPLGRGDPRPRPRVRAQPLDVPGPRERTGSRVAPRSSSRALHPTARALETVVAPSRGGDLARHVTRPPATGVRDRSAEFSRTRPLAARLAGGRPPPHLSHRHLRGSRGPRTSGRRVRRRRRGVPLRGP